MSFRIGYARAAVSPGGWIAAALLVFGACASSPEKRDTPASFDEISLEAENLNWADMVVSVRCGTLRRRLGTVSTNTQEAFAIPPSVAACGGQVTFEADPIGSDEVYSSPIVVLSGGETWTWRIAVQLHLSTLMVR